MTRQDRIAHLLARGMNASQVAALTATRPELVSEYLKDPEFRTHIEALTTELGEQDTSPAEERAFMKDRYAAAEHKILDHIVNALPMSTAREAAAVLDIVGKRRDAMEGSILRSLVGNGQQALPGQVVNTDSSGATITLVQLNIPSICAPELHMTANKEIIAIGDRSTAAMPINALKQMMGVEDTEIGGYTYDHASAR